VNIVFFILLIGPLIFFHELGHFIAARIFGVGVIRFSIGFGPKLLGITRKGTEYVIGAFPLGGYVRMVGMERKLPSYRKRVARALWHKPLAAGHHRSGGSAGQSDSAAAHFHSGVLADGRAVACHGRDGVGRLTSRRAASQARR
jgi:membrane-associated protease RseP (regulator of RpoE activity)